MSLRQQLAARMAEIGCYDESNSETLAELRTGFIHCVVRLPLERASVICTFLPCAPLSAVLRISEHIANGTLVY